MTDFRGEQGATGARESDESVQDKCGMPIAKRVPKERVFHGDTFIDEYEWLRDKESHDVQDYVAAQNRYCEQRMEPLKTLRSTLFDELKSHVQENDMSVPTRMDGYWYFVRTQEGQQYAVQCRVLFEAQTIGIRQPLKSACHRRRTSGVRHQCRSARP